MKKGIVGMLCIFGMRLILTIVACVILRFGMIQEDVEVGAGSMEAEALADTEWISQLKVAGQTSQIIIVVVEGTQAVLSFYEKENDIWREVLKTEACIGRNGIGKVREGDNKTPIGMFQFIKAFGILENPGTKLDYVQVDASHYWVDDKYSTYYNQFVSTQDVQMDWESAEHLCEYGALYHYVLALNYNQECVEGAGSAIFLHCSLEKTKSTAGCIAIPEADMREIIKGVDEDCVMIIDTTDGVKRY